MTDHIEGARLAKAKRFVDVIKSVASTPHSRLAWAEAAGPNEIGLVAEIDNKQRGGTHPVHNPSQETWELVIKLLRADVDILSSAPADPFEGLPR